MTNRRFFRFVALSCAIAAAATYSSCNTPKVQSGTVYASFEQQLFEHPDNTFRAVPFYSLNDRLDSAELVRQISLMKQAGYGGAFLHSRIGLLTPYLGEEWFRMMQIGTQALQALDMDVWYYDEDKWPSGFAGGIVPRQNPDFRARCLIRLPLGTPVEAPDSVLLRDDHYLYVCRVNPMGQPRYNGTCWVDLMNPGTVRAFIESSYTPYVERFGGHPRVRGMFTDEPNVIVRPEMAHQGAVSYSPVLDSLFRARCGYELQPVIPALFDTVGEWRRIRLDYYRTVAYALEQAFSKPIGDYCAGNGWIWTGHYNGEDTPGLTMANTGNLMQQLRHMQQPGLDALALRLNTIYSAKGVTSVANQYGRQRRLCELFGIGGHNLSFEDRMWITSWNTIMGINFMCPHLYQYSLKGERKRDYPPAISHQQPYWPYNGLFEDFSARLCYFATAGVNEPDICVIHPQESAYLETQTSLITPTGVQEPVLAGLMRSHRNFDFGDEQIISETGRTDADRFVIGEMAYRGVVLPELTTIRRSTLDKLVEFAEAGGTVVVCGDYPRFVDGEPAPEQLVRLASNSVRVPVEGLGDLLAEKLPPPFRLEGAGCDSVWTHLRRVRNGMTLQLSNFSRKNEVTAALCFDEPDTRAVLWNPVNGECLRLMADSTGTFRLRFAPAQTWIVSTGRSAETARCAADYRLPGERRTVATLGGPWRQNRLSPNALTLDYAQFSKDGGRTWSVSEPVLAFSDRAAQSQPYNGPLLVRYPFRAEALPRNCSLVLEQPEMYASIRVNGRELRFGQGEETPGKNTGTTSKKTPGDVSDGEPAGFYLDRAFRTAEITPLLKKGDNEIVLALDFRSAVPSSYDADERYGTEIESVYLTGDFAVRGKEVAPPLADSWRNRSPYLQRTAPVNRLTGFVLTDEPAQVEGDMTLQGYPFFAGSMTLEKEFDLERTDSAARYFLTFPACEATVIGINVNGTDLSPLFASPWEADVTPWLRPGSNKICLTLTNTLRNLLGPHHHKGGEFTEVRPVTFRAGEDVSNTMTGEPVGECDWYDARLKGRAALWRDAYHIIPSGLLAAPEIRRER